MKTRRILMGALALAMVAATVFACTKDKETNVAQQATETKEAARKPIATYDNATGQMTYHFDMSKIQQKLNESKDAKTCEDRYVVESVEVLDNEPNNPSVLPEIKITVLDTEEEKTSTMWLMQCFTEKEVRQNATTYYADAEVRARVFEFGYRYGEQYYKVSVNGDDVVTSEIDSPLCLGSRPKFLLRCNSSNCADQCEKTGTFWNSYCKPCPRPNGQCVESNPIWLDILSAF